MENINFTKGLEGVFVDETQISDVNGELGELSYRGYKIEDLATQRFVEVAWLVLSGNWPTIIEKEKLTEFLKVNGKLEDYERRILQSIPKSTHSMVMLQSMIPVLNLVPQEELEFPLLKEDANRGLVIIAKIPTLIAGFHQYQLGNALPEIDFSLNYHENFLAMFTQKNPSAKQVQVLDVTQILQMEHGYNAGTFAGRVTASTLAPIECVISASIGTLYGKLHGGADQAVLEMALKIGSPDKAEQSVLDALGRKEKIMGMGHREYKIVDPRATILKPLAEKLTKNTVHADTFETLKEIERTFRREMLKKEKDLWANVEFYKGAVFYALGIPPEFFTSLFAMSRSIGYLAHFLEFRPNNRLIRPKALYTGPQGLLIN